MSVPLIELNDGHRIPQVGVGTWPLRGEEGASVVATAIELGYRHIDTARRYENEDAVGEGVRRSGIDRDELFITTKLDGEHQGDGAAFDGIRQSLERLGTDHVDLLLIHWPLPQRDEYVATWRTFERVKAEGLARSIGVSNFKPAHLDRLAAETGTVPAVNQIQLSPAIPRLEQRRYGQQHGIVTESWTPIKNVLDAPVVVAAARKHGVTPAQAVLRWHVQQGLVVIPKSSSAERLRSNLDLFGFELDADDLAAFATLDQGPDAGVDSDTGGH